jgi:hypothetical protein
MSLYLDIPLGGEAPARSMTGLFVPANFQRTPTVDIVIYLHGFKRDGPSLSISSYWNGRRFPQRALREGVNTSGKNVLLVAPTLGPRSQAGRLVASGGFDDYVDRVRAGIGRHVYASTGQPPDLGTIIVAAHSGGGEPMRRAVLGSRRYAANIRECWGFDCLYSGVDAEQWARWARAHPAARLFVYFTDGGGTKAHSLALRAQGVPNVLVERSPAPHDYVPITHWAGRLAAAPLANTR